MNEKKIIYFRRPVEFLALCLLLGLILTSCIQQSTIAPPTSPATSLPTSPPTIQPTVETVVTVTPSALMPEKPEVRQLDPVTIPKFVTPLVIPPAMQPVSMGEITEYEIAVRQFQQQILPEGFPITTVWGYGKLGDPLPGSGETSSFNFPGFSIEARSNEKIRVTWVNQLVDDPASETPHYLPHLLPVDQTLHWADPDPQDILDSNPYTGPVPIVTHLHGAHVASHSDGNPDAWYLPDAIDIPTEFDITGSMFQTQGDALAGSAVFEYTNDQPASTLWYHDHTIGITRLNVYAGMAGFWILRDEVEDGLNLPGPSPQVGDAAGTKYYEIPIAIQDRTFNDDGSLFYPDSRTFFDGYEGPYLPDTIVPPIWNPEFFGDSIVVNGKTWPYLEVEPRLYRLRLLNGCNSRYLFLKFDKDLKFTQIGTEGGFLPDSPIVLDQLLMAPAERKDVIIDFSEFKAGDEIILMNLGPDGPFSSLPIESDELANPETTGLVMKFKVVEMTDQGSTGSIPTSLPSIDRLSTSLPERNLTLNELMYGDDDGIPVEAHLGTESEGALEFTDPITENPMVGDTEIWNFVNLTGDSHPIHLHLVMFQVVERVPFDVESYLEEQEENLEKGENPPNWKDYIIGDPEKPKSWETGWKDTVTASPDHVTRIIANFDMEGSYVWHCHILEHEDNEMMRPFYVGKMQ